MAIAWADEYAASNQQIAGSRFVDIQGATFI
jgi:hypothetical protein